MKKRLLILAIVFTGLTLSVSAQPRPENNSDGSEVTGPPIGGAGGSAPIGGGLVMMLAMGAAYAGKKIYNAYKE